jgi:hypothetical protein
VVAVLCVAGKLLVAAVVALAVTSGLVAVSTNC